MKDKKNNSKNTTDYGESNRHHFKEDIKWGR